MPISTIGRPFVIALIVLLLTFSAHLVSAQTVSVTDLHRAFQSPPDDARIMMRWWWFGPAVTKPELEREMRLMKEGGIGGFEVQPVYPLAPDDDSTGLRTLPFLSDDFIEALRFTADKARELGLRMDLTLGSGWPFGGPQVPINQAAGRLRYEHIKLDGATPRIKVPYVGPGEKLIAVFVARPQEQGFAPESVRQLPDIKEGVVQVPTDLPAGNELLFFISSRTGMQVKRPAVGAEGFVLDHLDQTAIDNYLQKVGDRLMQAFGPQPPHAIFCDSLEVYNNDWTGNLLPEFQQRRGYDLTPYLPALVSNIGPKTAAVRHDWGMTLTELLNEHFLGPMREWSKRNHVLFRIQDYGVPAAILSSNAYADLPEGEGSQWKTLSATRWASSASHHYGHQVTSSETWTWLHSPVFRATPLDMKAEADRHFLQGINQLIGHGWPYTVPGVEYPGWRFYAAAVFDEKNPWWIVMPDIAKYLQRLSFLLRQGKPANNVAIYLPNDDAWSQFSANNVHMIDILRQRLGSNLIPQVLESGNNFDFFDDGILRRSGRIENGALVLGEQRYRIVILPNVNSIPLETFEKLQQFAHSGVLVATRTTPREMPGLQATPADQQKISRISEALFKEQGAPGHLVEDETKLAGMLSGWTTPDLTLSPASPDLGFIHRSTSEVEIYFVANTANVRQSVKASFSVKGMRPEFWDPLSGDSAPAEIAAKSEGGVTLALDLEPYASQVIVFSQGPLPSVRFTKGASVLSPVLDLSTDWQVSYGQNDGPRQMDKLRSWTDSEQTKFFSGTATYEKQFILPATTLRLALNLKLDFGPSEPAATQSTRNGMQTWLDSPVREAAVVYLNDHRAGSLWCPPYVIDVTRLLKPGENRLRIEVANTALNYMAGHSLPDYRLLNLRYGERFQAQDMDKIQALPSGLLGPIRLLGVKE